MPTDPAAADSLIPDPHAAVLAAPAPRGPVDPSTLREFGDFAKTRKAIYDNVFKAVAELEPTVGKTHTLRLVNPQWADGERFTRKDRKRALLTGGTLARRMRATWELADNATGEVIDRRTQVIARVPYLTSMGTFVHNGNDYTLNHQQRLLSGAFARQKDNGEIETHINIIPGKGVSHRYFLDPAKGTFHMKLGQATLPLMGVLKALGATDADIKAAWGDELYAVNYAKANDASAVKKLKERLLPKAVLEGPRDGDGDGLVYDGTDAERPAAAGDDRSSNDKLIEVIGRMELDPEVTQRTLGKPYNRLCPEVMLAATNKLLRISRGEAEVDDRDHLAYQTFLGPEDLFAERIRRDHGRLRRQLLMKASFAGSLKGMPSGSLTPQLEQALLGSGLGQAIEEINPAEVFDKQSRISRLGEGGIPCYSADTEVLTSSGWKPWPSVGADDRLACRVDGRLEFSRPSDIHAADYTGPMFVASTSRIDYCITPDHRVWASKITSGRAAWSEWQFWTAESVHGRRIKLQTAGQLPWTGGPAVEEFVLPPAPQQGSNPGSTVTITTRLDGRAWVVLLAAYLADGSFSYKPSRKEYRVEIGKRASRNPAEAATIRAALERLPFGWRYEQDRRFVVSGKHLAWHLSAFGKAADKYVPDYVREADEPTRRVFFDTITAHDCSGWSVHSRRYASASRRLRDDVAFIGVTLGYAPTYYEVVRAGENTQYGVLLKTAGEAAVVSQRGVSPYRVVPYSGRVYCASVPGGLLLTRRNGKVHWSGNSVEAVPDEARGVQPSHMGYMDPLRTPESFRVGVDVQMSRGARKGQDGRVYAQYRDLATGGLVWKSPQDVADTAVAFPGALNLPNEATLPAGFRYSALAAAKRLKAGTASPQDRTTVAAYQRASAGLAKRVPVMKGGKITYVPRDEVDLELPAFEDAFSPLGNLVPLKSMVKGQRVAMASRMLTQALPLVGAEAPLVQGAVPGSGGRTSFEEEYGRHMGAVRADRAGRVVSVRDGVMRLQYDGGGGTDDIELYEHFPFNRKTYIHQRPVVHPGEQFKPGQLLVTSNYTDATGATALGLNARVAYLPYKGYNFEDALVISEGMAKRLSSEHMYQHEVEADARTKLGKAAYVSLFSQKYEKPVLDRMDANGVIRAGETVEFGQPLILAAKERDHAQNKVHKQRQAGFSDASVVWKHHDPGVVTDVVMGRKGPVVLVKSVSAMQVGDKMCYDPATEILTTAGWVAVSEVRENHKVATLDPDTHQIEYLPPAAVHSFPHSGNMYRLATTQADLLVTDNHQLYAKPRGESAFRLTEARDLYGRRYNLKRSGNWTGSSPAAVTLPGVLVRAGQGGRGSRVTPDLEVPIRTYAMVLGMFLSEGNLVCQPESGSYGFDLTQIKPASRARMIAALTEAGVSFSEHGRGTKVRVYGVHWYNHLKALGTGAAEKFIPDSVFEWDTDLLAVLYEWLMWGDGCDTGSNPRYTTTSRRLADGVQRLALHLGWSANITVTPARRGVIKGKEYQFADRYDVSIYLAKNEPTVNHGHAKQQSGQSESWVPYEGPVYCVTMPRNHVIYVRRNGKPVWCGNSGRYGDKGVVAAIVPDARMPHGQDGKPFEVLLNPLGVISRTNPAQKVEAMLGKIARLTGKPIKVADFESVADMTEYAERELAKHGLKDLEDVVDPETGRKTRGIAVGERFFMKLHHTAESKGQGRGSGGYGLDETPSKGGETGCFVGDTLLLCYGPLGKSTIGVRGIDRSGPRGTGTVNIGAVVENRLGLDLPTGRVTDFFHYRVPPARLVEIELENGQRVAVTVNHKLFRPDGTVVLAGDVRPGDDLAEGNRR